MSQPKPLAELGRQARWAAAQRFAIIEQLGAECDSCGDTADLEIDHQDGRDWEPRTKSRWQRIRIIKRELAAGVRLRLLCRSCNGHDGAFRRRGRRSGI